MRYIINPCTGWNEEFASEEAALIRAKEIIIRDEGEMRSLHGYEDPSDLIDERWENLEEMYASLSETEI